MNTLRRSVRILAALVALTGVLAAPAQADYNVGTELPPATLDKCPPLCR